MLMSGHQSKTSFKTYNCHLSDKQKSSVSSCLSNVANPNQATIAKSRTFRAAQAPFASLYVVPREEVEGNRKRCHPMKLNAILWSSPPRLQKFSSIPSSIIVFSILTGTGDRINSTLIGTVIFWVDVIYLFYFQWLL